jgi:hypothetical protein
MYLRPNLRHKDGKDHTYWSLVETVRTPDGPRQRTLCSLGELNDSAQARGVKTIEVFNAQGESRQLKLFPAEVAPPEGDASVARVRLDQVHLERARRFGDGFLALQLWVTLKHLLRGKGSALSPNKALTLLSTLVSADIVLPTTDGREIRLRRVTTPSAEPKQLLDQLGITVPDRLSFDRECSVDLATA